MAIRRCPSCGHSYNGKRCKNCLYEPFGEVISSFELHPRQSPSQQASPSIPHRQRSSPSREQKKHSAGKLILKRIGIYWLVLILITSFLPAVLNFVTDLSFSSEEVWAPQPETVPLPQEGIVLYEDADILVLADWDGVTPIDQDIPIYVQNFTGKNLVVCTNGAAVNGCMAPEVFFYCEAYRNSVSRATLWIDPAILEDLGIQQIRHIQMAIDVADEDYNLLTEGAFVAVGDGYQQEMDTSGEVLFDQDGFRLIFQGWETDIYGHTTMYFYGENNTDMPLELSGTELLIDGKETGWWLWQNFFPGTRSILSARLIDFEIGSGSAVAEMDLFLTPNADLTQERYLGTFVFPLG